MASRPAVKYIQYYTDGSAARQPEIRPQRKPAPRPKPRKRPQYVLYVQPLALAGILVSAVMLIMMTVGCVQLWQAQQEKQAMANYVDQLAWNNKHQAEEYEASLDLEDIRQQALALGMVPEGDAGHMEISLPPVPEEAPTGFWRSIGVFLEKIF